MQRGRFAQEFLLEVMREPKALRTALMAERARWLRSLKLPGREETLFEFEVMLRAIELSFDRRHPRADGQARLGQDFAEELRCVRDALHRAGMVARRLTAPNVEQGLQFRAYVSSLHADDARRSRTPEASDARNPDESLFTLRTTLRSLQGLADQLLRQPFVGFQAFSDFAVVGEHLLRSSRYFRPPEPLEFRGEYDRVGSVRLLELVKQVPDDRARKALALAFLACFRLLRALRHIPATPVAAPRRAVIVASMVADECQRVAAYLGTDLPRLTSAAPQAERFQKAGTGSADRLRDASNVVHALLAPRPLERASLEKARVTLVEAAKSVAGLLSEAVEPGVSAAELFDGARARRDRAEKLRTDLAILARLLRRLLDGLFPVMQGQAVRAGPQLAALGAFAREFRSVGYYLLRTGDHEPFDRFFSSLDALSAAAPSPARDKHLYLECRRFLGVVDRAVALVGRRVELVGTQLDDLAVAKEAARFEGAHAAGNPLPPVDPSLSDQLLTPPGEDDDAPLAADLDSAEPEMPSVPPPAPPRSPPPRPLTGPLSDVPPVVLSDAEKEDALEAALAAPTWRPE